VESSSRQLLTLIEDIINVSKIAAGELKINKCCCNLGELFKEVETTFNELKKKRQKANLIVKTIIPDNLKNLSIVTDKDRVQQVLNNLIGNAIKFTEEGSVEFGYKIANKKVVVSVRDTGIGIPVESKKLIFERF